jgi:predicted permease
MRGHLSHDARIAWRGLARRPFYAIATIIMLALAIGANAIAFGIFYDVELAPLPYRQASHLVMVRHEVPKAGLTQSIVAPRDYVRIMAMIKGIADAGLWTSGGEVPVPIDGKPRAVTYSPVTPSWFRTLGIVPSLGRLPSLAAGRKDGPAEVMISYKFWQSDYGGATDVLGRTIDLGRGPQRIVGILPRHYAFLGGNDVLSPLVLPLAAGQMDNLNYFMIARPKPGVSLARLNDELQQSKSAILQGKLQKSRDGFRHQILDVRPLRPMIIASSSLGSLPYVLQGMALLLLVLATVNAANLTMVRQRTRNGEFVLRRVLGASRGAVMRLPLLEQIPIGLIVVPIAIVIAWLAERGIDSFGDAIVILPFHLWFGWQALACVVVLTLASLLIIVLLPLAQLSRRSLDSALGLGDKATIGRAARRVQRGLGIVQIVLGCALLIGSAGLGGSLYIALHQPLGFRPHHRLIASVLLPPATNDARSVETIVDRLQADPRFRSVGGIGLGTYPFSSGIEYSDARRSIAGAPTYHANMAVPEIGYFRALGMTIRQGRRFTRAEYLSGAKVAIVSAGFARHLYGTDKVVGRSLRVSGVGTYRIVGVTDPVIWRVAPWHLAPGTMFLPLRSIGKMGSPLSFVHIVVRYRGSVLAALPQVRRIIEAAIPGTVVTSVRSYDQQIFDHTAFRLIAAEIALGFAVAALILAALGVYAVNALIARSRLPEFGLRAMLGANPARLLRSALTDAAWLLGFGLAGGAMGGYLLIRAMSPLLYHVREIAPLVFAGSLIVVAAIVLIAAWRPAAAAASTPVKTLLDSS